MCSSHLRVKQSVYMCVWYLEKTETISCLEIIVENRVNLYLSIVVKSIVLLL